MKKPNWKGVLRNGNEWKLKFHGVIETRVDREKTKKIKRERENWNQLARRTFDPTPRLVKA